MALTEEWNYDDELSHAGSTPSSGFDISTSGNRSEKGDSAEPCMTKHSKEIRVAHCVVLLSLLVGAIVSPIIIFNFLRGSEVDNFKSEFKDLASVVVDSVGRKIASTMTSVEGLSMAMTSHGLEENLTWPFVTLPFFDFEVQNAVALSQTLSTVYAPIIDEEERDAWEKYTADNTDWVEGALARQAALAEEGSRRALNERKLDNINITGREGFVPAKSKDGVLVEIYAIATDGTRYREIMPGPFTPAWQFYPLSKRGINYNYKTNAFNFPVINHVIETSRPNIGQPIDFVGEQFRQEAMFIEFLIRQSTGDPNFTYDGIAPISSMFSPIFDSFSEQNRKLEGMMVTTMFWPFFFEDSLPENAAPVYCVVQNGCGRVFTMSIEGGKANFLGMKDLHQTANEDLVMQISLAEAIKRTNFKFSGEISSSIEDQLCPFSLSMYPTGEMYDRHKSSEPIIFAVLASALFALAGLLVSSYEIVVKRRLSRIEKVAKESGGMVSSLYPETVRDRMLERARSENKARTSSTKPIWNHSTLLPDKRVLSRQIADSYPQCTVFFAYLSGFDEWSQCRDPEQIFLLLEAIFTAFDKLTHKHKVFKIETIMDSYLAATGLPHAQPDHAVRISRFAKDCLTVASKLLENDLAGMLGENSNRVQAKIGLHSGELYAGVMDGDKSRFCVFGDTVNLASRIGSSGEPGFIHVSPTTAKLIDQNGKARWLKQRQDVVTLKGKGKMTTFWLGSSPQPPGSNQDTSHAGPFSTVSTAGNIESEKDPGEESRTQTPPRREPVAPVQKLRSSPTTPPTEKTPAERTVDRVVELLSLHLQNTHCHSYPNNNEAVDHETMKQMRNFVAIVVPVDIDYHRSSHIIHALMSAMKLLSFLKEDVDIDAGGMGNGLARLATSIATVANIAIQTNAHGKEGHRIRVQSSLQGFALHPRFARLRERIFGNNSDKKMEFAAFVAHLLKTADRGDEVDSAPAPGVDDESITVLTQIVRASRLAHSMQHWSVFIQWNEKRFLKNQAAEGDESEPMTPEEWHKSELGMFDDIVLSLARYLKGCGAFSSSIDGCLSFAIDNQRRWAEDGLELTQAMKRRGERSP